MKFGKTVLAICILFFCVAFTLSAEAVKPYKVTSAEALSATNTVNMVGDYYADGYTNGSSTTSIMLYNLRNKYKEMTCTIGTTDRAELSGKYTFKFYVDNVLVKTVVLTGEDFPEDVTVDLNYQRQMKIELVTPGSYDRREMAICNIDFR